MPVKWYGAQFKAAVNSNVGHRILAAAIFLKNQLRRAMSRPNSLMGKRRGGRFVKSRGTNPSLPGEYPKKLSGFLRRNVNHDFDPIRLVARVGTNVPYGRFLQLGTSRMKPRPWLTLGLRDNQAGITRLLSAGKPI